MTAKVNTARHILDDGLEVSLHQESHDPSLSDRNPEWVNRYAPETSVDLEFVHSDRLFIKSVRKEKTSKYI